MQGSGAFLSLWEGESGASAHGEAGIGEPMGQDSLGVLAAHGQQLVQREGGGAEDGLEGDGLDALSPQLTQRGQRDAEGGCEPSDADGEGIAALGARVGDVLAVLVGDSQAGEGRGGCGRGGRAAVRRGRRLLGDNRSFRLHRAGDGDLIDDLAVGIGGGDFCARTQLVLDGVEVKLTAFLREGLAVGTAGLGGQLKAARQIDDAAADAVTAAVAAVAASGVDRTAGDGDTVEAADAVAADFAAVAASGVDRIAGDGDAAAAADAVAAVAVFAVAASGFDRTAGNGDAAVAADAVAAHIAAVAAVGSDGTVGDGDAGAVDAVAAVAAVATIGSDRTTAGNGDAAAAADAVAAVAVFAVAASGFDRTAGNGDAAVARDATAVHIAAVAASGVDRTAGDGETAVAVDAVATVAAVCTAATLGRQAVIFAAGDGETAGAGDAVAAIVAGVADTTGEMVVALQGQRHVAFRSEGGTGVGLDVHIVQLDLDLIVLGVDGHGVGRSGTLITICDDGVGVFHLLIRPL